MEPRADVLVGLHFGRTSFHIRHQCAVGEVAVPHDRLVICVTQDLPDRKQIDTRDDRTNDE